MKIIHCADLHLDSKMNSLPTEKNRIRKEETLLSFEKMISFAKENGVSVIILAGDTFDTGKISAKSKSRVLYSIENAPQIDFLYLSGNHDEDGFVSSLEHVPENLKVFGSEWTYYVYGNVTIAGVVLNENNTDSIYDTVSFPENGLNVAVLHGQIAGYKTNSQAETISIPRLKGRNIDYLALGHIHSYSEGVIDNRGTYVYSGCLEGRGFDETGDKGFVLLDVTGNKIFKQFVKFSSRDIYVYEYDVTGKQNFLSVRDEIVSDLKKKYDEKSLIKLVIKGEYSADFDSDYAGLSMLLNEYFFFVKIEDKTVLQLKPDDYETDKSIKGEFVRKVLSSDLSEEEKKRIVLIGLNALKGKEF